MSEGVLGAIGEAAPAVGMVAVFALVLGGIATRRRDRRKAVLMLVLAAVIFGNVLVWTI